LKSCIRSNVAGSLTFRKASRLDRPTPCSAEIEPLYLPTTS
jgi:hypothetical protein